MIKQKAINVCDFCKKELNKPYVEIFDVPNEGCSYLQLGKNFFEFGGQDYCNLDCFFNHVKKKIK